MAVTLPAVGSMNWGDSLNNAVKAIDQSNDAQKLTTIASGSIVVDLNAAISGNKAVTFPAGRFSVIPMIVATAASNSASYVAGVGNPTVNGFTAVVFNRDSVSTTISITVNWIAVATL